MNNQNSTLSAENPAVIGPLPVIPLRDMVVIPNSMTTVFMGRPLSVLAAEAAMRIHSGRVILLTQRDKGVDTPTPEDFWDVAVSGEIDQLLRLPDGSVKALVHGTERCRVTKWINASGFFKAEAEILQPEISPSDDLAAYSRTLLKSLQEYASNVKKFSPDHLKAVLEEKDPIRACDIAASFIPLTTPERLEYLRAASPVARFELLIGVLDRELESGQIEKRIQLRVKGQMEKNQREYYLNEQMKAIKKELGIEGEGEDGEDEDVALERKVREAKMPEAAESAALSELKRLKSMPPSSAEASVVRSYVDTLLDIPWKKKSRVSHDIARARRVLDEDHWGLEKVKERILEYLAVQKRVGKVKSPILCLVGGPGVGKTSLGRSIARATNREYVRMALGGVSDEAEIRGHRRTYVGAMPGQVIKHLIKAKVKNPLFLLDEIDKIGANHRGDPASALLEVLDPEQNNAFEDHYVECPFDLSDVLFVATSNSYDIPPALLDRMEVISLSGYTEDEKVHIALRHLVPKQMRANGVKETEARITEGAVRDIIRYYTREAGVRALERSIGKILRKIVLTELEVGKDKKLELPIVVDEKNLEKYLGVRRFSITVAQREPQVGIVNGLSWSEVGGDILTIEAVAFPGKGQVLRTGMLGDVMKESVEAARSVVRSRAQMLGLRSDIFANTDWHIHFPEGAIPKDGPSAGAAITTAMVSTLTHIPVRSDIAMTGEITLRGEVLPIGGLKEKLLAAQRGNVKTVLIPEENMKDLTEINEDALKGLEIVPVKRIEEVLRRALLRMPEPLSDEAFAASMPPPQTMVPPAPAMQTSA
ncbi:endopeptidase La [uncultured Sutterella sp.]|uniref:endopeptidase La n=1 Tax=uncultured Sutterella sp. TaxID=286133 RepID=UPI00280B732D|nr:endopeptidase La [uncultured Sutterella sp.]